MTASSITGNERVATIERLRSKKPIRAEYRVHLSDEPIQELREARRELDRAESLLVESKADAVLAYAREQVATARERVEKARAQAEGDSELLVFQGLPRDAFQALVDEHQPSDEDRAKGRDYDPKTFPPALIAATCVDPGFESAEEVAELIAGWNITEREHLFITAMSTCMRSRTVDLTGPAGGNG